MARTKFRSIRRKKRRGFMGFKGSRDITKVNQETVTRIEDETESDSREPDAGLSSAASEDGSGKTPIRVNKCATKIQHNSSFSELEDKYAHITRSVSSKLGKTTSDVELATGFKLVDFNFLQEQLMSNVICRHCRKKKSKLLIYQNNKERNGLAEQLFLKCNICEHKTPLPTSKRLGGQGGGAFEVNRRSVMATLSTGGGLANLEHFCTQMNLPAPVHYKPFQDHLRKIHKESLEDTEKLMKEATKL